VTNNQLSKLIYDIKSENLSISDFAMIESLFFSYSLNFIYPIHFILVLAGKRLNRVETVVDIYHKGRVKIILSGGVFNSNGQKECERYFDYCIMHGVKKEDIILENQSTNTYQNLLYSIGLIQKSWFSICHILIISSVQHLPRVSLTIEKIKKEMNFSFTYQCYPSKSSFIDKSNWYSKKENRKEIVTELEKIVKYHLLDS